MADKRQRAEELQDEVDALRAQLSGAVEQVERLGREEAALLEEKTGGKRPDGSDENSAGH